MWYKEQINMIEHLAPFATALIVGILILEVLNILGVII